MNTKEKSLGYNLFVDEEMDDLFHVFSSLFDSFSEFIKVQGVEIAETIPGSKMTQTELEKFKETYLRFLLSTCEQSHLLGWCKDPGCTWVPKEKKE